MKRVIVAAVLACFVGGSPAARGQSLFRRDAGPATTDHRPDANMDLRGASLLFVEPPKAKEFQRHGQVTIIIDETSKSSSKQLVDLKKDYSIDDELAAFISMQKLLELQVKNGDSQSKANVNVTSKNKFKGDGQYNRTDQMNAKITATILDVKPNGVLVLEARKTIVKDEEVQTLVLSGSCRGEDVSNANTVLSSQLADLAVVQHNEGQVKDNATKGWIPRVLDAIFNF